MVTAPAAQALHLEAYDASVKSTVTFSAARIYPTQAILNYDPTQRAGLRPKVCIMFTQHSNCRQGGQCKDFHVQPDILAAEHKRVQDWLLEKEKEFFENEDRSYKVFYSDLKEVIDVPSSALMFTRGLFLDVTDREKRASCNPNRQRNKQNQDASKSSGPSSPQRDEKGAQMPSLGPRGPTIAQQAPTACNLFNQNPENCKWGKLCNQAHVNPQWIAEHRSAFDSWSARLEQRFAEVPDGSVFPVHDPVKRCVLHVPKECLKSFTRGLAQATQDKCPSVCLLDQNNRCTAGVRCNQAHVIESFLVPARQAASAQQKAQKERGAAADAGTPVHADGEGEQQQHNPPAAAEAGKDDTATTAQSADAAKGDAVDTSVKSPEDKVDNAAPPAPLTALLDPAQNFDDEKTSGLGQADLLSPSDAKVGNAGTGNDTIFSPIHPPPAADSA